LIPSARAGLVPKRSSYSKVADTIRQSRNGDFLANKH
jgi:hypothetical protein